VTDEVTVKTLERLLDAFNAHDLDAVSSFSDDCVLEMPRGHRDDTDGMGVEVQGCDLFEHRDGRITRKGSYWKIREK
jgi:hypothetical protein